MEFLLHLPSLMHFVSIFSLFYLHFYEYTYLNINILDLSTAIKCFNCAVTEEILTMGDNRIYTPSCTNFNGSSSYIVDCKYSTMCSRIISTRYLQNGFEQKTVTLGCSQQKSLKYVRD